MTTQLEKSQEVELDLSALNRENILSGVDAVVDTLYATGNIRFAVAVLERFDEFQNISGFARAKLLWAGQKWFVETKQRGNFYEKFGAKDRDEKTYTDRLIRLWDCIQSGKLPASIHSTRKVRELLPISEAISQGFVFSQKVWNQLVQAKDMDAISQIVQKAKGKQPRKGTLRMTVDSRGFITGWQDGQAHHLGTLNYADLETDPVVAKGVLRIKGNNHIKDE